VPGGDLCLTEEAFLHGVHHLLGAREEQQDEQALHNKFLLYIFTYFTLKYECCRENKEEQGRDTTTSTAEHGMRKSKEDLAWFVVVSIGTTPLTYPRANTATTVTFIFYILVFFLCGGR
jgi:hypothetical protein